MKFDTDIEAAVLGAMMIEVEGLITAMPLIKNSEIFYSTSHQAIFLAIQNLYKKRTEVDILTVTSELRKMNKLEDIGGAYYITTLTSKVSSSAHIEEHIRFLLQFYITRQCAFLGDKIMTKAENPTTDVFHLMDEFQQELINLNSSLIGGDSQLSPSESIRSTLEVIKQPKINGILGIPTGNGDLSEALSGWQKKKLYYLCGLQSHFKTSIEIISAITAADEGYEVDIFTPDMSRDDLNVKFLAYLSGIDNRKVLNGRLSPDEWIEIENAGEKLASLPIYIFDNGTQTPSYMRGMVQKRKHLTTAKHGVGLAIIDHIHRYTPEIKGTSEEKISSISGAFKIAAQDLDIAILALCQLSRAFSDRDNKRPQLSDMKGSGALEQDGDGIIYTYFPYKHYTNSSLDPDYSNVPQDIYENLVEKGILKSKLGVTDIKILETVDKPTGRFTSYGKEIEKTDMQKTMYFNKEEEPPF
jgi:replicative DNA helicase